MQEFRRAHPYLIANIPMLALTLLIARSVRPRDYGRLAIAAGLFSLPSSLIAFSFEGDYWTPVRLGGLTIGVEDLVFCFVAGALAWLLAGWPLRRRIRSTPRWRTAIKRYAMLGALGGSVIIGWEIADRHSMMGFTVSSLLVLTTVLVLRRQLWVFAISGALLYPAVHILVVRIQFWIWPDYVLFWNTGGLLGRTIAGVPLFEFAWSVVFGAVWPVIVAFVTDTEANGRSHTRPSKAPRAP